MIHFYICKLYKLTLDNVLWMDINKQRTIVAYIYKWTLNKCSAVHTYVMIKLMLSNLTLL